MSLFSVSHVRTRTANNHLSEIKRKEEREREREATGVNNHRETTEKVCKVFRNR